MARPWAPYEVGFIDHAKFRALAANAICLWIEGKNYCDKNVTDGLIPAHIVKQFRFYSRKSVELLTTSIGAKNETEQYSPLWESHPVGYRMHDYLEYNDCRDEVMARIDDANVTKELRKTANRERQKKFREQRKAALDALRNGVSNAPVTPLVTPLSQTPTETSSPAPSPAPAETSKNGKDTRRAPIHATHKGHACCGRVCMPAVLFGEFVQRRNHPDADREIDGWATGVLNDWAEGGKFGHLEPGDSFDFWRAQYALKWPAAAVSSADKRLPVWARS